jgi:hypothetical protein
MEKEWAGKQTNWDESWVTANIIDDLPSQPLASEETAATTPPLKMA